MHLYILWAIPLIAFICYIGLLLIVYRQGARQRVNQAFMLYLLTAAMWSLGSFAWRLQASLFWNRILVAGVTGTFITFFQFVRILLGMRAQRHWLYLGYGLFFAILVANLLGYVTRDTYFVNGIACYEIGPAMPFMGIYGYVYSGLGMYYLIRQYSRTLDRSYRNKIQYLVVGLSVTMLASFTNFVPEIGKYPIDIAASVINGLLIAYAILRYQLLDITLVIRKGLVYSSLTALIAGVYLFIVFIFSSAFRSLFYGSLVPAILVASAIAVAFQPMRDRAQLLIDRLFFREKYDAQLMLQELSELAASILDINKLTSILLDRLTATMHVKQACIVLQRKETAHSCLVAQKGQMGLEDEAIFREDHPVVRWMASHKGPLTRQDMDVLPQFKALWTQERADLDRIEAELFVPLLVREELIGILILGPKLSEAPYSPDEQLTLITLANQTAVAIQNAWLYSDLEQSLEELKQMQAQLIQTEKLSAVGEMIAGVAHEINNPLTVIIGYSQLLRTMDPDLQAQKDIGQILEAGLRVKRIVASLLDFSRQHPPQKEYVDINQIVSESLALRGHDLVTSNIQIETDLAPDLPPTTADGHQLQQVFVNIINNAQQAMAEKGGPGVLTVTTRRGKDNTIRISFQDTGPGIPKEIMGRIFDPFFTTKEVGQGTGLGLSVSYGIVQEHEGCIWAESEDGQGAAFFIELPIHHMSPAHTQRE